jgi:DNA-binding NarL/FixJ family response regulator
MATPVLAETAAIQRRAYWLKPGGVRRRQLATADSADEGTSDRDDVPLRLLITADVPVFREALAHVFDSSAMLHSAHTTTAPSTDAVRIARALRPDAVLVDVAIEGSFGVIQELATAVHGIAIVAFGAAPDEADVIACAGAGASAYVGRFASLDELCNAVQCAARGRPTCSARAAGVLIEQASMRAARPAQAARANLTPREHQVVQLIERGMSNKEIASLLCIEVATVKNHIHHIFEKVNVSSRSDAAAWFRGDPPSSPEASQGNKAGSDGQDRSLDGGHGADG